MKNQIYKLGGSNDSMLDFWIAETNELNPYKETVELEITLIEKSNQYDFSLEEDDIKSLIKYLTDSLVYIKEFNENSKPIDKP